MSGRVHVFTSRGQVILGMAPRLGLMPLFDTSARRTLTNVWFAVGSAARLALTCVCVCVCVCSV